MAVRVVSDDLSPKFTATCTWPKLIAELPPDDELSLRMRMFVMGHLAICCLRMSSVRKSFEAGWSLLNARAPFASPRDSASR